MNTLYKTLKTKEIIAVTSNKDDADKIVKALEKQIPKQINIKVNEFKAEDGYCPNCNERIEVAVWASEYCYECGQKLDWD